jgi:16S rRNA processing protein RimM
MNVARIARTHGRTGEVVVHPLDGLPFCLYEGMRVALTPPDLHRDRWYTVARVGGGQPPLVSFEGVSSLNDAEPLVGKLVLAARDDVPEASEERALLDCVGHEMVDVERGCVGTVAELIQLPANDVWRVEGPYGSVLVPVIDEVVVALPEGRGPLTVRLLPGLLPQEG